MHSARSAFTLVELLIVIAILALISTLAIQKLGGIQESSKEKVNHSNVVRIGAALETYAAANGNAASFDRLDALVLDGTASGTGGDTSAIGSPAGLLSYDSATNIGLSSNLTAGVSMPYMSFPALLGVYYPSEADVRALRDDLGLATVMRGADPDKDYHRLAGSDGSWAGQVDRNNPNACSTVAHSLSNGVALAAVNPAAVRPWADTIEPFGAAIYKAMGEDVLYGADASLRIGGTAYRTARDAADALLATGGQGLLLAFGLGDSAFLLGKTTGGLDSAPLSPTVNANEYGRYLVLVRLRRTAQGSKAEFAGVLDPYGRTASMLR